MILGERKRKDAENIFLRWQEMGYEWKSGLLVDDQLLHGKSFRGRVACKPN